MTKLNFDAVLESLKEQKAYDEQGLQERFRALQVVVHVMCGGGFLGRMASEQPAEFYIDDRASARTPYPLKQIQQAVQVLTLTAQVLGYDPNKLPHAPDFHCCGIW